MHAGDDFLFPWNTKAHFERSSCSYTKPFFWLNFTSSTLDWWWNFKGSVHYICHVKLTFRGLTIEIHRITSSFHVFATTCTLDVTSWVAIKGRVLGNMYGWRKHGRLETTQMSNIFFYLNLTHSGKVLWYLSIRAASSIAAECGSVAM